MASLFYLEQVCLGFIFDGEHIGNPHLSLCAAVEVDV